MVKTQKIKTITYELQQYIWKWIQNNDNKDNSNIENKMTIDK